MMDRTYTYGANFIQVASGKNGQLYGVTECGVVCQFNTGGFWVALPNTIKQTVKDQPHEEKAHE
jgi:hypothetical protein